MRRHFYSTLGTRPSPSDVYSVPNRNTAVTRASTPPMLAVAASKFRPCILQLGRTRQTSQLPVNGWLQ